MFYFTRINKGCRLINSIYLFDMLMVKTFNKFEINVNINIAKWLLNLKELEFSISHLKVDEAAQIEVMCQCVMNSAMSVRKLPQKPN